MTIDAWLTAAILVGAVLAMATERLPPSLVTLIAVIGLDLAGVVDHAGAFGGLANPAPLAIAALYVLAAGVEASGALTGLTDWIVGRDEGRRSERGDLLRVTVPAAAASAFVANTPLVAMLAPRIDAWCRRTHRSASRYLMPLSYATVLGGVITVLGTSTNLTVNSLLVSAGMRPFGMFEFSGVGLAIAVVGVAALVVTAPWLLPARRTVSDRIGALREFTVEMTVTRSGPLAGRSVEQAGLRSLAGVYLVELRRGVRALVPVAPDEPLEVGDRLTFAGDIERIVDLQSTAGLRATVGSLAGAPDAGQRYFEAVVGEGLAGMNLRQADFRNRIGAAVLAIHRAGDRVAGKLGDVPLRIGDVLVVVADRGFSRRWRDHNAFLLVAEISGSVPPRRNKVWIVRAITLGLVVTTVVNLLDLTQAAMVAAIALVATRVLSVGEAREAIDFNTVALVGLSFGLGNAVDASGLDEVVARGMVRTFGGWGDLGILLGVLLATMLVTELLSNNAAAILMFPVALESSNAAGLEFRGVALAILIGASCSFLTPIGYQTNTLVYGLGGYRFSDFTRVGLPLTLLAAAVSIAAIPLFFPLR